VREDIWTNACQRMSERCGRTASPDHQRLIQVDTPDGPLDIEIHEPSLTGDNLGLKTWGSALVCANRLVRDHAVLQSPVLELGSGTGVCAITAAKLGFDVVATDLPEIVPNLRRNVDLNCADTKSAVECAVLDWANPDEFAMSSGKAHAFSTVLVADPIYSAEHPAMVCNVIDKFLSKSAGARLCVQLPLRPKFEDIRQDFYQRIQALGLTRIHYDEEISCDDFGETTFAWSLWRR
jgi:predicted nicotinamide N-methyase